MAARLHPTKVIDFTRLDGGLNLWDMDYHLPLNQSPEMKNMWWEDGILQSRPGQSYILDSQNLGTGHACYDGTFWDSAFFHIGTGIYAVDMDSEMKVFRRMCYPPKTSGEDPVPVEVPEVRGTFFRYGDDLYYKTRGAFIRIKYHPELESKFSASNVVDEAQNTENAPTLAMNMDPLTGAGDMYQPENRLSPYKKFMYNAKDGVTTYRIPIKDLDAVVKVVVDGLELKPDDYNVELGLGIVTFITAPPVQNPPVNNTVEITVSKVDEKAFDSIMGCRYAAVYGVGIDACMVLGGCEAQPNGVFWNGNDSLGMNPAYWPMSFYNLVGDTEDMVTGFGKQYSELLVFKNRSVGKLDYTIQTIDGRDNISLTYQSVNSKIGCDLPWTIQLIENNLVFCNSKQGVFIVRDSSAAYENNIQCISRNVNGDALRPGLLADIKAVATDSVCSFDDSTRYWVCVNGNVYVWDYTLSDSKDPSWFYLTNVAPVGFFLYGDYTHHLNAAGALTKMEQSFYDYDGAIEKVYKFPAQNFGTYDRLKDVLYCIFALRHDSDSEVDIDYESDYETWRDPTGLKNYSWRLSPRNLEYRNLNVQRFAHVEHHKPGARHVRHFAMRLSNNKPGQDLAIVSAQIFYRLVGRDR